MKSIKIIAGSYGYRPAGSKHVKLINKHSGVIQVEAAEAERLVNLGVAVIIETNVKIDNPAGAEQVPLKSLSTALKTKRMSWLSLWSYTSLSIATRTPSSRW